MKKMIYIALALVVLTQCREGAKKEEGVRAEQPGPMPTQKAARDLAMKTQAALGGTLQKQIAAQGLPGAIGFCNVRALPITDSVATANGAGIRRVTDKARNPANRVSDAEAALMDGMRAELAAGNQPGSREWADDAGVMHYYFPIMTSELCLKCHGTPGKDIPEEVMARLGESYPRDEATGYGPGQLRGMWKVTLSDNP